MKQVAVIVEGQTEQRFISEILGPHLSTSHVYAKPVITKTSNTGRGGGGWRGYRDLFDALSRQPQWDLVTSMIDYFRAPAGFPGAERRGKDPYATADLWQDAIQAEWSGCTTNEVKPFFMVHEFEALVIAAGAAQESVLGDRRVARQMRRWVEEAGQNAEAVNGGPQTAPSKRLERLLPDYVKTADGLEILQAVSLEDVLPSVPRFDSWLQMIRSI